jgi:hypothetical protein
MPKRQEVFLQKIIKTGKNTYCINKHKSYYTIGFFYTLLFRIATIS